jgi:hypothetical protein
MRFLSGASREQVLVRNVRNILDKSVKLAAQERLMVLYDRRSPLSSLLSAAYGQGTINLAITTIIYDLLFYLLRVRKRWGWRAAGVDGGL